MMQRLCKRDALRALRAWARGAAPLHTLPSPPGSSGGRSPLRYACPFAGRLLRFSRIKAKAATRSLREP